MMEIQRTATPPFVRDTIYDLLRVPGMAAIYNDMQQQDQDTAEYATWYHITRCFLGEDRKTAIRKALWFGNVIRAILEQETGEKILCIIKVASEADTQAQVKSTASTSADYSKPSKGKTSTTTAPRERERSDYAEPRSADVDTPINSDDEQSDQEGQEEAEEPQEMSIHTSGDEEPTQLGAEETEDMGSVLPESDTRTTTPKFTPIASSARPAAPSERKTRSATTPKLDTKTIVHEPNVAEAIPARKPRKSTTPKLDAKTIPNETNVADASTWVSIRSDFAKQVDVQNVKSSGRTVSGSGGDPFYTLAEFISSDVFGTSGYTRFCDIMIPRSTTSQPSGVIVAHQPSNASQPVTLQQCVETYAGIRNAAGDAAAAVRSELVHFADWYTMWSEVLTLMSNPKSDIYKEVTGYCAEHGLTLTRGVGIATLAWYWLVDHSFPSHMISSTDSRRKAVQVMRDEHTVAQRLLVLRKTFGDGIFLFLPRNTNSVLRRIKQPIFETFVRQLHGSVPEIRAVCERARLYQEASVDTTTSIVEFAKQHPPPKESHPLEQRVYDVVVNGLLAIHEPLPTVEYQTGRGAATDSMLKAISDVDADVVGDPPEPGLAATPAAVEPSDEPCNSPDVEAQSRGASETHEMTASDNLKGASSQPVALTPNLPITKKRGMPPLLGMRQIKQPRK